ncbi:eukaryotic translation initiation factor 5B-like [Zingiber officinale]|uniref:eukaryotic translation initiation factor 5B-like n=1 Tax=Zingiber officinale TaxID=94328 RepID=UPI001C4C0F65|nr:eukaryotic translation initiation factor 5B-like [Zingiber officinale]
MGRKKNVTINDDEYSLAEEQQQPSPANHEAVAESLPAAGSKKSKKGGKNQRNDAFADETPDVLSTASAADPSREDEGDGAPLVFSGKKKSSKSKKTNTVAGGFAALTALGDEADDQEPEEKPTSEVKPESGLYADDEVDESRDFGVESSRQVNLEDADSRKQQKKKKKGGRSAREEEDLVKLLADLGEAPAPGPSESQMVDEVNVPGAELSEQAIISEVADTKKQQKKKKKKGGRNAQEEEDLEKLLLELGEAPAAGNSVSHEVDESTAPDEELSEQVISEIADSKKQQKKKKKKSGRNAQEEEDLEKLLLELGEAPAAAPTQTLPPMLVANDGEEINDPELDSQKPGNGAEEFASKKQQKKKKKKSGKTAQEEEDLDKILAELGEGPPPLLPSVEAPGPSSQVVQESVLAPVEQPEVEDKDGEIEGESAAAKKKKKKKEKKAAAAATPSVPAAKDEKNDEAKGKVPDKKLPKHVREMQEALVRRKEAEERKKREEEEKLRKEEEERKRLEELERQAEEVKRRKKEREKEKLLKKKQEGKLLTAKQKDEQRRLEAMRKQFLSQNEIMGGDALTEIKKRPRYNTKKPKQVQPKAAETDKAMENENEVDEPGMLQVGEDAIIEEELHSQVGDTEDKVEGDQVAEDVKALDEDEDDEEWDAKSWDDLDVTLPTTSPFSEEDQEATRKPVVKGNTEREGNSSLELQANPEASAKLAVKKVVLPQKSTETIEANQGVEGESESVKDVKKTKEAFNKQESTDVEGNSKKSGPDLRSPICCILGHVDTGKTKLLDCIRRTNVQEGEAGGITQQIGATYFPTENIRERTRELKADATLKVPGLLVIDTPGHESFANLRSRGSSLCDIAIVVVDIMHGLEQQTIESLNLLKSRNTEFIVALNKVDRLYGWKSCPNAPIAKTLKQQSNDVMNEFNMRLVQIITQFKEQGLNTALYYKNREMGETFNIVPTSAVSGEGIPDLLLLLVQWAQKTMEDKLTFVDEVQCTVLEVKVIEGLGTTIDVVLVNGVLHEGDQIVVCGMQGPIVTSIRALLTPHPMKELRVKGSYLHHKELKAAQGVKISAQGLEHAIAGTSLYVVKPEDDLEELKKIVMQDVEKVMSRIDKSGEGVYVQASTLGSLEALTEFLRSPAVNIPFCDFSIGPVHKKDVMKASVMLERKKEYATILAFDVKVMADARELAEESGVRIFVADIIYHLFDQFKAYIDNLREEKKKESAEEAVFPCVLKIMPNCIFNKKDPIVLGVDIIEGILKVGTPICIPSREFIDIGRIASIEINHKQVDVAKKGQKVAIKIVGTSPEEQQKMFGRHFEIDDELVSHISRRSIDILKANYRDDLTNDEWRLVVRLKTIFKLP